MVKAVVVLSGSEGVSGTVHFVQEDGHTNVSGQLAKLEPGVHRLQINTYGDTTNGGSSTGPHFNQAGDWNVTAGDDHKGSISVNDYKTQLSGPNSIIGRALVVLADTTDLGKGGNPDSNISGNAGAIIAFGVIGLKR